MTEWRKDMPCLVKDTSPASDGFLAPGVVKAVRPGRVSVRLSAGGAWGFSPDGRSLWDEGRWLLLPAQDAEAATAAEKG